MVYIIYNHGENKYIVSKDKISVEEYFLEHDEVLKIDQMIDVNDWIENQSSYDMESEIYCVEYNLPIINGTIYLSRYNESGGGGSYHDIFSISINKSKKDAIDWLENWFNNEHDHEDDETELTIDECKKYFKNTLKTNNIYRSIDCYNDCIFEIIKLII